VWDTIKTVVISHLDYCKCLLAGAPAYQLDRLQAVQIAEHNWSSAVLSPSLATFADTSQNGTLVASHY